MLSLRSLTAALVALALPAVLVPQQADALHVAIICSFGTRSDIAPIFEGLRDFALEDGNKVSYVAAPGLATTHAGQFPYVETQLISNVILPAYFNNSAISDVMQTKKKYDNTRVFLDAIGFIADIYEHNTRAYIDYFEQGHKFDLVMCDAVEQACMDAAKHTGQKLAIYGPLGQYGVGAEWYVPDFLDPMPMEQWIASPWQRAKGFIDLIPFAIETIKASWKVQAAQQRLQLNVPYMDPWEFPQKNLMLAHHVLGIDPARNVPTNIQVFGPVVNEETIPPIEPELQRALDGFKAQGTRAVFIAFGSVLTLEDSPELYAIMLDSIATLLADPHRNLAVIWASAYHDTARTEPIQKRFPGRFLTPKWANQRRALMHDAVQLAINHAGYGSITEALYNGKAQIMLPFVFDEFVNTANAEEAGISLSLDKYTMTSEEMTTKVTLLLDQAADPTSVYAQNLHKWKTICRLNSEKAKAIVTNAVKLAASVGVDHLVPRDVTLSLFDRFDIGSVVLALLVVSTLRKLLASHHKPSPQTAAISAKPKRL